MDLIAVLNLLSRVVLFLAAAYKTYKTRDKGWALLTTAFFINVLDVESYILTPLGIKIPQSAYDVASKVPNFYISMLLLWGALHLKYEKTELKHVMYLSVLAVSSYIWIFLLAAGVFGENFTLKSSLPSLLFGGAFIYIALILWNYVVSSRLWDRLFPVGLFIVGILNLTYPLTRPIDWFAPIGFFLAALGRILAAIGAAMFVFYPLPEAPHSHELSLPSGAYLVEDPKKARTLLKGDLLAITRTPPQEAKEVFSEDSVIFWITKAREGVVGEKLRIIAISPTKIGILQDLVKREVDKGYKTIYVDAFEYLSIDAGFETALKFLLTLRDMVVSSGGTIVVVAGKDAFKEKEWSILKREFSELKGVPREAKDKKTNGKPTEEEN